MKTKSLLLFALVLCLTVCLCACGKDTTPTENTTTTTQNNSSTTTTTTGTQTVAATTTTKAENTYTVKVVDEGGNPIAGINVQWCLETCIPGLTNEQGVATPLGALIPGENYKVSVMESSLLNTNYTIDNNEFYYEDGSYELTIVLKTVA